MTEEWCPIRGYEGLYEVSNLGRVRTLAGPHRKPGIRSQHMKNGYLFVPLWRNNRGTNYYVHRLVAEAFCEHPEGKDVVRHLDGNPMNNYPGNLAWGTHSENAYDKVRHGRNWLANITVCKNGHELTEENLYHRSRGGRRCKPCANAENKRSRERAKANGQGTKPVPPWPRVVAA